MAIALQVLPCNIPIPGYDYTVELLECRRETNVHALVRSDCHATLRFIDGESKKIRISYHEPEIFQKKYLDGDEFLLVETGRWAHVVRALVREGTVCRRGTQWMHPHFVGKYIHPATLRDDHNKEIGTVELIAWLNKIHHCLPSSHQPQCATFITRLTNKGVYNG